MLSRGNGNPMNCISNLLRITRGECAYDRIKGIDSRVQDMPSETAKPLIMADAKWLIQRYEPRVNVESLDIESLIAHEGHFGINVGVREV